MRTKRRVERMQNSRKVQYEVADFDPKLHYQIHVIAILLAMQISYHTTNTRIQ